MPENILVVEYEPRYTDRVRQALAGQPYSAAFAKDGEEALRALAVEVPNLIVLSSVVPKISTGELIRAIRNEGKFSATPILLTVSGYNGKSPKADAQRLGASDILPKPYSETEFLGKVHQMLSPGGDVLTSNQIFGDLLEDDRTVPTSGVRKTMAKQSDDLDKMLADTLAGVMPQKKTQSGAIPTPTPAPTGTKPPAPTPPPVVPPSTPQAPKARTASENVALDKMLEDTLSGLDRTTRAPRPAPQAPPVAPSPAAAPKPAAAAPAAAKPSFTTEKIAAIVDKMPVSSPVLATGPPAPVHVEEEEPKDGVKFGQYVLLEKIAVGGMAEVWKARMRGVEGFQKIVAIKKILPHLSDNQDFIEMFIDEAKLAAQLNHNNIIHIYDLGKIQSSYYIAMEYVDGSDLKTILKRAQERDQPMSIELALFVASKIASALDYAHRKRDFDDHELGLVHRDVSPQNVLISEEGDIKLCDFGIAKAASKASHTQAGALKGKLQYMSPEQAWGKHIDKRSDIFALATVLFEMLTGRRLFTGDNELSILEQVREARVTAPSQFNDEVTPEIDAIVLKALQKEPEKRYQTAGEMARDLDQVLYSFRPTPTSADLAIYMHRLGEQMATPAAHMPEAEPFVPAPPPKPAPVAVPAAAAAAAAASTAYTPSFETPSAAAHHEPPKKKSMAVPAIAAVVILVIAGAIFMMTRGGKGKSATTANTAAKPVSAPPSTAGGVTGTTPLTASNTTNAAPTTTAPDQSKVDEEVRKRLEAERLRLEQNRAQQTTQQAQAAPPVTARPAPVVAQPVPQQAANTPAPAPAPQPVVPAPQPVVENRPAPAPQPAAAEAPRTHEGDLVPPGTEGLAPAHITRQAIPTYPPLARAQKVEGTVVVNVLVSEAGRVLDAKVLTGVNRPVGINEAAVQAVRNSAFAAGVKDGVRVKSWTTVVVAFKL
jgi:TonB family protein